MLYLAQLIPPEIYQYVREKVPYKRMKMKDENNNTNVIPGPHGMFGSGIYSTPTSSSR